MNYGVVFPQTELEQDAVVVRDYAQAAEAAGFAHILAYEHVLGANPDRPGGWQGPYTYQHPFQEPFVLFSFLAGVTQSIRFTTGILILPQRQTALVAKQAACLDVLCGGRLRLGVGLGWNAVEYQALNQNFHNRGRRIEEQIEVLRLLWTQPLVTYSGRWHAIPDAGLNPLPLQRPIPIWFGGHAEPVLERAARLGDGWMPNYRRAADAQRSLELLTRHLERYGKHWARGDSDGGFGLEARLHYADGNPDSLLATIREWESAGATHISLNTMGAGLKSAGEHIAAIQSFARLVGLG